VVAESVDQDGNCGFEVSAGLGGELASEGDSGGELGDGVGIDGCGGIHVIPNFPVIYTARQGAV
jgi:hypothetical protein